MQEKQQLLTKLFLNHTLKNSCIFYDLDYLHCHLNSILEQIQQVTQIDKIKILQQLIIDTSYNSPLLCSDLLYIYREKYNLRYNYFNLLLVFKNLYKYITNYALELSPIYLCSLSSTYCMPNTLLQNYDLKYSIIRENNDDDLLHNLKLIFVYLHKAYNQLVNFSVTERDVQDFNEMINLYNRQNIFIPETLFCFYDYYLDDFNLSKSQYKFFFNIITDLIIKNYQKCLEISMHYNKIFFLTEKDWTMFLDKIFSNWDLLYNKHKQFFKQNGKEMINIIYQAQDSVLSRKIMDENKKNELLNLIEIL